ncbi:sporulation initiation inhibitor Soj [endosymbiont 'TC1' of Trimyema compressum]|uniref:ParA family protein n=1 Tax=endosymbiont 'TC1' of Trimyema compressum TaxID=243899 RepID=UPI0007F11DD5|nr:AAA family ATPase [endosymbiont 'TC1' of Trimyema compressum]AMP21373.1 sporulation initiation inhibitor Soj [endosymbiont 'TC1' of Trimyema compressum]
MKTIAIINQKGGVAKTTTTINLGAYLASLGKKTLIVDLDPQGNATSGLGINRFDLSKCIYDGLINDEPVENVIHKTAVEDLDLIPATIQLAGAEIEMVAVISREYLLKNLLKTIVNYDYILIDCPPSLGLLTLNALTAADNYIVPIQCEYYALEGLGQLLKTVELVKKGLNPDLEMRGALMTMYNANTNLSAQVVAEVKAYFKEKAFKSIIPRSIRLSEAPSHGEPISIYDKQSKGALAYEALAKEVIKRG